MNRRTVQAERPLRYHRHSKIPKSCETVLSLTGNLGGSANGGNLQFHFGGVPFSISAGGAPFEAVLTLRVADP